LARFLADKKHYQIPAGARLAHCRINVFSSPVPFLNKSKIRRTSQNVSHFILRHTMFAIDLLDDLFEPDDAGQLQSLAPCVARDEFSFFRLWLSPIAVNTRNDTIKESGWERF
jgi:hypothetical protein